MKIVMLGAPGAGKGTQAQKIAHRYNIPHISTGDILRANIKNGTELGKKAKEYMDRGLLAPDELVAGIIVDRTSKEDCAAGYVLDGFPRTLAQARQLGQSLKEKGEKPDFAVNVEVPDKVIIERMAGRRTCPVCGAAYHLEYAPPREPGVCDICGGALVLRDDDSPQTVERRLKVYHEQTEPLIGYYEKEGILRNVDGTADIDEVFKAIAGILG